MLCLACHTVCPGRICARCRADLRPAPERLLEDGMRLVAAFEHVGAARELVHSFKYRGLTSFADLVVETIAPRVPRLPVVPVPRAVSRQIVYGIDPARELAVRLARCLEVPIWDLLVAPLHSRRRAGGDHSLAASKFRLRRPIRSPVVLVDDVVTTGATVISARKTLGHGRLALVVAANAADTVSSPRI